jgi:hypothetical protein
MATNDERHQMILHRVMRRPDAIADSSFALWQRLSTELSPIIGDRGFQTLYTRSVHLLRAQHPWLEEGSDPDFEHLRTRLGQQDAALAGAASTALLTLFTDTLIVLIGEPLTSAIMHAAWNDAPASTAKETQP